MTEDTGLILFDGRQYHEAEFRGKFLRLIVRDKLSARHCVLSCVWWAGSHTVSIQGVSNGDSPEVAGRAALRRSGADGQSVVSASLRLIPKDVEVEPDWVKGETDRAVGW